ncbi:MAG: hypothetical protein ABIG67_11375 [Pseudomonadota bacterium]
MAVAAIPQKSDPGTVSWYLFSDRLFQKENGTAYQGMRIRPGLSRQIRISKKIPPGIAVTWDLRVWATDALAEWIVGSSNGLSKTLKSEVTSSGHNRYGSDGIGPDESVHHFKKA